MKHERLTALAFSIIDREREYQEAKGFDYWHDGYHSHRELSVAAAHLLVNGTDAKLDTSDCNIEATEGDVWNLRAKCAGNRLRELTVAAALAVAELEREIRVVVNHESSRRSVINKRAAQKGETSYE